MISVARVLVISILLIIVIVAIIMVQMTMAQFGPPMYWPPRPPSSGGLFTPFNNFPQPNWFNTGFNQHWQSPYYHNRPKPISPVRKCRNSGACRPLDHGTTLRTPWKIQTSTLPTTFYTTPAYAPSRIAERSDDLTMGFSLEETTSLIV